MSHTGRAPCAYVNAGKERHSVGTITVAAHKLHLSKLGTWRTSWMSGRSTISCFHRSAMYTSNKCISKPSRLLETSTICAHLMSYKCTQPTTSAAPHAFRHEPILQKVEVESPLLCFDVRGGEQHAHFIQTYTKKARAYVPQCNHIRLNVC